MLVNATGVLKGPDNNVKVKYDIFLKAFYTQSVFSKFYR